MVIGVCQCTYYIHQTTIVKFKNKAFEHYEQLEKQNITPFSWVVSLFRLVFPLIGKILPPISVQNVKLLLQTCYKGFQACILCLKHAVHSQKKRQLGTQKRLSPDFSKRALKKRLVSSWEFSRRIFRTQSLVSMDCFFHCGRLFSTFFNHFSTYLKKRPVFLI